MLFAAVSGSYPASGLQRSANECAGDDAIFFMYGGELCLVECRKVSAVYDTAFFYGGYRNDVSLRVCGLDAVKFGVADVAEKYGDFHIVHSAGDPGGAQLHGQGVHVVPILGMEICLCIAVF